MSNEDMQFLWAQLLAGEIAEPGTYSLRTLQLVRMLRQSDAELFRKFCNYLWDGSLHIRTEETLDLLRQKDFPHTEFLHLASLGLIALASNSHLRLEKGKPLELVYFNKKYILTKNEEDLTTSVISVIPLTAVGIELAPLCDSSPDEEYRILLVESWVREGIDVQELQIESGDEKGNYAI